MSTMARRVAAVKAPSTNQLNAAALSKVKHPEAPYEAARAEEELQAQRDELKEMAQLLTDDPENFDRYFDQVAETGEVKQGETTIVSVEQVAPTKPVRKQVAKKAPARKRTTKALEIETPSIVPIVPPPPLRPGGEVILQED